MNWPSNLLEDPQNKLCYDADTSSMSSDPRTIDHPTADHGRFSHSLETLDHSAFDAMKMEEGFEDSLHFSSPRSEDRIHDRKFSKETTASFGKDTRTHTHTRTPIRFSPKKTSVTNKTFQATTTTETTTPQQSKIPLSPNSIEHLLSTPTLIEPMTELKEESNCNKRVSGVLEKEISRILDDYNIDSDVDNNKGGTQSTILWRKRNTMSPCPTIPTMSSSLVSPESCAPKPARMVPESVPATHPKKKRRVSAASPAAAAATATATATYGYLPLQHSSPEQGRGLAHGLEDEYHWSDEHARTISLTLPNLLMELRYPPNRVGSSLGIRPSRTQSLELPGAKGNLSTEHQNTIKKSYDSTEWSKPMECPSQDVPTGDDAPRAPAFVSNGFPLPSLTTKKFQKPAVAGAKSGGHHGSGHDFVLANKPSMKSFRRQWERLAKRKGHYCEHRMSKSEQRQLLRESFGRVINRRPGDCMANKYGFVNLWGKNP